MSEDPTRHEHDSQPARSGSRAAMNGSIDDELAHHLESRIADLVARGWTRDAAEREARRRLGDPQSIKRGVAREQRRSERRSRIGRWREELVQDLGLGFRRLRRSPGFAAIAILTLALGIGANSALFSVIRTVVLQPLPYGEPERLVQIWESEPSRGWDFFEMSEPNFVDYRAAMEGKVDLAAIGMENSTLTGGDRPERLDVYRISANLPAVLGIELLHGRAFRAEEDRAPAPGRIALLGYELWQRRFAADPEIVGRDIQLDQGATQVVGVLPPIAPLLVDGALFVPLAAEPFDNRSHHHLMVLGRGITVGSSEEIERELDAVAARLASMYPASNADFDTRVMPLYEAIVPAETRTALWILLGAVGMVLLIACANLSNLMLARVSGRQRELAVCGALGASRGRIARQLLTESLLVSGLGALVGLLLALRATGLARSLTVIGIPRLQEVVLDGPVLAFTAFVALAAGLLAGLVPALEAGGERLTAALAEGGRGSSGSRRAQRLRHALMVAEVAISVVLLAGAGLLLRSFLLVQSEDPGLDVERVLTMEFGVQIADEAGLRPIVGRYREILAALESLPGVESAAAISGLPFGGGATVMDFVVEGTETDQEAGVPSASWRLITPEYFRTGGIELLRGRAFNEGDDLDGQHVAVISRRMAERYWPDRDPIGSQFLAWRDRPLTIVGVVEDVRERRLDSEAGNVVYMPYYRNPWWSSMFLLTRTSGDPAAAAPEVRRALAEVAPEVPVSFVRPLDAVLAQTLAPRRFNVGLLATFAAMALVLAGAGVYGVVSYGVARRRAEIGLRMAMGAPAGRVLAMVVAQGMRAVGVGAAIGLVGALATTRLLAAQLYGIEARDPLTLALTVLFLALVGFVACAVPAARAAAVDPADTLREA